MDLSSLAQALKDSQSWKQQTPPAPQYGGGLGVLERIGGAGRQWGDHVFEETGSPLAATAATLLPDVAAMVVGGTPFKRGANAVNTAVRRPFASPVFNTETAVTNPALLQGIGLDDAARMAASDMRMEVAKRAAGGPLTKIPSQVGQGAWVGSAGPEFNPVYSHVLPRVAGALADDPETMRFAAQVSKNLTQDGNAVMRFIPHLINDPKRANALMVNNLTPAQIKNRFADIASDYVVAARPGNAAMFTKFDDANDMRNLMHLIKQQAPNAKIKPGVSNSMTDRVYMTGDGAYGPSYSSFGAVDRPPGLEILDAILTGK